MRIDPKYHFKLIGQRGAEIIRLREEFDVDIQLPRQNDAPENLDRVVISGFEAKAIAARDKIQSFVDGWVRAWIEKIGHVVTPPTWNFALLVRQFGTLQFRVTSECEHTFQSVSYSVRSPAVNLPRKGVMLGWLLLPLLNAFVMEKKL